MTILIRAVLVLIGIAATYLFARHIVSYPTDTKLIAASAGFLLLAYFNLASTLWAMRRQGAVPAQNTSPRRLSGHGLMVAGAVSGGFAFAFNTPLLFVVALACLWIADDFLTGKPFRTIPAVTRPAPTLKARSHGVPGEAFWRALEERRKVDPLVGAKLGGKEVFQRLLKSMKDGKGVHTESLLTALGALAGYACQAGLRADAFHRGMAESQVFNVVKTASGETYYFGNQLNALLAESKLSVWSLAAGAASHHGTKDLPDLHAIFAHVSSTVGESSFGTPRVPANHKAGDLPLNYLKALWLPLSEVARVFCKTPTEWPVLFGFAIQEAIDASKGVLDPRVALLIVMESAVPMSKVALQPEPGR
jgi:hypothetical protein